MCLFLAFLSMLSQCNEKNAYLCTEITTLNVAKFHGVQCIFCNLKVNSMFMKHLFVSFIYAAIVLVTLVSCQHDEPDVIKPADERRIMLVNGIGEIYDLDGGLITTLPFCKSVSQIIVEGDDYFVSGSSSKDRVGYWKNGKWNTLHVDFINDVEHWAAGIGKWDYYIYLLDYPNVLKNSGIFPLRNSENFIAANHGISVSEGVCHVVGSDLVETPVHARVPVMYSEHKGAYESERLPLPDGVTSGDALAVYAYDRNHVIVGGKVGREPAIWVDGQLQVLTRGHQIPNPGDRVLGRVNAITRVDGHIIAAGDEFYDEENQVATVWRDGVPSFLIADSENFVSSEVMDIQAYGSDVYILTFEYDMVGNGENSYEALSSVLWLNGKVLGKIMYKGMVSFAVY